MSRIDLNPERLPVPKPEKAQPKPRKYIRQAGKVALSWAKKKKQYLKDHPPNHEGYYICGICLEGGIEHWVHVSEVDVDHIKNRSLRPDLREVNSNLQPSSPICNVEKKLGTKTLYKPRGL